MNSAYFSFETYSEFKSHLEKVIELWIINVFYDDTSMIIESYHLKSLAPLMQSYENHNVCRARRVGFERSTKESRPPRIRMTLLDFSKT